MPFGSHAAIRAAAGDARGARQPACSGEKRAQNEECMELLNALSVCAADMAALDETQCLPLPTAVIECRLCDLAPYMGARCGCRASTRSSDDADMQRLTESRYPKP